MNMDRYSIKSTGTPDGWALTPNNEWGGFCLHSDVRHLKFSHNKALRCKDDIIAEQTKRLGSQAKSIREDEAVITARKQRDVMQDRAVLAEAKAETMQVAYDAAIRELATALMKLTELEKT